MLGKMKRIISDYRTFGRICLLVISPIAILVFLYMDLRVETEPRKLPEKFQYMLTQRDLTRYILPDKNTYLLLPKATGNGSVFIAVVVCSSVPNFNARQAIRKSWARYATKQRNIQVFFLLGKSSNDSLNTLVANESRKHMDIIQQDFLDTYNNLTLKSVMLLKWVNQYGWKAKYVMKTDDDMFVNLPNLFRFLKNEGHERMLLGNVIEGVYPLRDKNSKWFVPDGVFSGRVYPTYLAGSAYVLSRDTVAVLYRIALCTPFFHLEDVFITGICSRKAGLKPIHNDGFIVHEMKKDVCIFRSLITASMAPEELLQTWKNVRNQSLKCET